MILKYKKNCCRFCSHLFFSKFILKSPAIMTLVLLFSRDDITDENSSVIFLIYSLHDLGGQYIFPMVIVFDKLFSSYFNYLN